MGKNANGRWDADCTRALNNITALVSKNLPLKVPDASLPFVLYVRVVGNFVGVVLCQERLGLHWPSLCTSFELKVLESAGEAERYLSGIH